MGVSDASFPSPKLKAKLKTAYSKKRISERKRRVRFDDIEIIEYSSSRWTQKSLLWWTKEERRDILENNRNLAQDFRNFHREQVQHCNDIFVQCCSEETEDLSKRAKIELPTHIRGLEYGFLPASKRYRRTHVQQVLKFQAQIQDDDRKDQVEVLSTRAMRSSRPSRAMARIFGECDAAATKESNVLRRNRCRMLPTWW
jgi:hypothetical protein